jgi:hypothetical protein
MATPAQGALPLPEHDSAARLPAWTEPASLLYVAVAAAAHVRCYDPEQGAASVAGRDRPGVRMARIAVRPSWVAVLDSPARLAGGGPR